jgi:hypothetical protein
MFPIFSINYYALMSMEFGGSPFKNLIDLNTNAHSSWGDVFKNENDLQAW